MKRSLRGRRPLSLDERKHFALRFYGCIVDECGSFENFKQLLHEKARLRESTVRGWLPPLTRLNLDPVAGTRVLKRDWEAIRSPDFPSIVELAKLLNVSVDYLLGLSVPRRLTDRQPIGEISEALAHHLFSEYRRRGGEMSNLTFCVLAETLDGERRTTATDEFDIRMDTQVVLKRIVDSVFSTAQQLQQQQDVLETVAWSERLSRLVARIHALLFESRGLRRQQLRKLLDEVGMAAIDPERLAAGLWLDSIEAEVKLAEAESRT